MEESIGKKLVKIFKKELQTGDHVFDDMVYVTTSDKPKAAAFLDSEEIRAIISGVVVEGGAGHPQLGLAVAVRITRHKDRLPTICPRLRSQIQRPAHQL